MTATIEDALLHNLLRDLRKDMSDQRSLLLQTVDYLRKMEQRLDARMVASRDDLELMLKSELMGRLSNFEARVTAQLDHIESIIQRGTP